MARSRCGSDSSSVMIQALRFHTSRFGLPSTGTTTLLKRNDDFD